MAQYEQSQNIDVAADEVFEWLSDVDNLPKYLPPIKEARIEGSTSEGQPGQRLYLRDEIPDRGEFESKGYLETDGEAREMRWEAESSRDYFGSLKVDEAADGSLVTVHLTLEKSRWKVRSRRGPTMTVTLCRRGSHRRSNQSGDR